MTNKTFALFTFLFLLVILGGIVLYGVLSPEAKQPEEMYQRIERLENLIHQLTTTLNSNRTGISDDTVDINDLFVLNRRLSSLENSVTELAGKINSGQIVDRETSAREHIPEQTRQDLYSERLMVLESEIEQLRNQVKIALDSISPIANLGSPEEELLRANRYFHEFKEPSTATHAYMSLLERYPLTYVETLPILNNAVIAFDSAAQKQGQFVLDNILLMAKLEAKIRSLQPEHQGELFSRLANACMHGGETYHDAARFYQEAINKLPDSREKVSAYWSMAFALREVQGEDAFLNTLSAGYGLGSAIGVDVNSFEKELDHPRARKGM